MMGTGSSWIPSGRNPRISDPFINVERRAPLLIVCTYYGIPEVKKKVVSLVSAFQDLFLLIKKPQRQFDSIKGAPSGNGKTSQADLDLFCSFCHRQGHGANLYPGTSHIDIRCSNCSEKGHPEATCCSHGRKKIVCNEGASGGRRI